MSITALLVLKSAPETPKPVILANAFDFSGFNIFHHPNIVEFVRILGRIVASRTLPSQRQSVRLKQEEIEYTVHAYNRNGLCAVGFMDDKYPVRSAFSLLNQVLDEYQKNFGETWRSAKEASAKEASKWSYLAEALENFKDPGEADKLLNIERELDETNIIFHKTIDSLVGEKHDSLVKRSSDLNVVTKMFNKRARKINSGCTIL